MAISVKIKNKICETIKTKIMDFSQSYRSGPSLYFYKRIRGLRKEKNSIRSFLENHTCVEILYATLVSWDMNSRAAKMKDFVDFQLNLLNNLDFFIALEQINLNNLQKNQKKVINILNKIYNNLDLMSSKSKLVSNSKCLHFLFPSICMPMDKTNTLTKLYNNMNESSKKYIEITQLCYEIIGDLGNLHAFFDGKWNTCETKLIDNAIIFMEHNGKKS